MKMFPLRGIKTKSTPYTEVLNDFRAIARLTLVLPFSASLRLCAMLVLLLNYSSNAFLRGNPNPRSPAMYSLRLMIFLLNDANLLPLQGKVVRWQIKEFLNSSSLSSP